MLSIGHDDLMLASKGPIRDRANFIYETKLDGYRALAFKGAGGVRFMSRNGKKMHAAAHGDCFRPAEQASQ